MKKKKLSILSKILLWIEWWNVIFIIDSIVRVLNFHLKFILVRWLIRFYTPQMFAHALGTYFFLHESGYKFLKMYDFLQYFDETTLAFIFICNLFWWDYCRIIYDYYALIQYLRIFYQIQLRKLFLKNRIRGTLLFRFSDVKSLRSHERRVHGICSLKSSQMYSYPCERCRKHFPSQEWNTLNATSHLYDIRVFILCSITRCFIEITSVNLALRIRSSFTGTGQK